ncbi:neutral zinc metallopeptidase [Nocardioides sp.]|uniref:KPN_02809 family neutral zinc metallopeptidase n=1 Tax=Nocardioides sp. TaxID=35761 RepID=UPI001A30093B|nr:neutral zinc metallopeptidase [Nocardioides sp.]MBJ7359270.1 neutral zinc metallopeptidase [Nocardioides sp.]
MRFNPKATIDKGGVRDAGRGRSGGGLQGLPIPSGAAGGGIGGVILIIIIFLVVQFAGGGDGGGGTGTDTATDRYNECKTGADANESADCARELVEDSLRAYWESTLQQQTGTAFEATEIVTFTEAVSTGGCGSASSAVGPFYCPLDKTIYLDSTFFADVLEGQLGGSGGDFVEPYVLAHEYGHHIQNLLGTMGKVKTQQGPDSDAVRLELQADCYAGMWTKGAMSTTDAKGVKIFDVVDRADIEEAIDSAKAVGDDRIQEASGGEVDPEGWTHGSSKQRVAWFETGLAAKSIDACDTFSATQL